MRGSGVRFSPPAPEPAAFRDTRRGSADVACMAARHESRLAAMAVSSHHSDDRAALAERGMSECRAGLRAMRCRRAKWRRGWDSNPRCPRRHGGFQDRCIRPLCHLSGTATCWHDASLAAVTRLGFLPRQVTRPGPSWPGRSRRCDLPLASRSPVAHSATSPEPLHAGTIPAWPQSLDSASCLVK